MTKWGQVNADLSKHQTYEPGQGNNAYIFPGAALGIITAGIHHISDSVFLSAAEALSDLVTSDDLAVGRLYPPLDNIREISVKIATKAWEYFGKFRRNIGVLSRKEQKKLKIWSFMFHPQLKLTILIFNICGLVLKRLSFYHDHLILL